ncbi:MAG: hypothetical protein Q9212_003926 [Teloschistes hypoglaucus]
MQWQPYRQKQVKTTHVGKNGSQVSLYPAMDGYPLSLATALLLGEDRYRRLLEQSSRLFKDDEIEVEVLQAAILGYHHVFTPFLDCVHSFGFKAKEDDYVWNGFHRFAHSEKRQDREILRDGNYPLS